MSGCFVEGTSSGVVPQKHRAFVPAFRIAGAEAFLFANEGK
jgi:hypothetical protein